VFSESEDTMAMTASERGKKGFAALAAKYGRGAAYAIMIRAKNDKARSAGNRVVSCAQSKRDDWRAIEKEAKDIYGKWY
jgi:hypothetical protein